MRGYNYFSGLFGSSSNTGSGLSSLYSSLGDYNTIRRGSYKKLLSAYYNTDAQKDSSSKKVKKNTTTKVETESQQYSNTKKYADKLTKASEALVGNKNADLYKEGKEDELIAAVNSFASSYNTLVENASSSSATSVSNAASTMESNTRAYSKSLEQIGIKVGKDNKLTVDSGTLKAADKATVKKLLGGTSSFVGSTMRLSAQVGAAAVTAEKRISTYNSSGSYSSLDLNKYFNGLF